MSNELSTIMSLLKSLQNQNIHSVVVSLSNKGGGGGGAVCREGYKKIKWGIESFHTLKSKLLHVVLQLWWLYTVQTLLLVYILSPSGALSWSLNHITVIRTCYTYKYACRQHTYTRSCRLCNSTSLPEWGRAYGGRRNMDNVRTELTPLWFHSADSLINRNVWPENERKRKKGRRK